MTISFMFTKRQRFFYDRDTIIIQIIYIVKGVLRGGEAVLNFKNSNISAPDEDNHSYTRD